MVLYQKRFTLLKVKRSLSEYCLKIKIKSNISMNTKRNNNLLIFISTVPPNNVMHYGHSTEHSIILRHKSQISQIDNIISFDSIPIHMRRQYAQRPCRNMLQIQGEPFQLHAREVGISKIVLDISTHVASYQCKDKDKSHLL